MYLSDRILRACLAAMLGVGLTACGGGSTDAMVTSGAGAGPDPDSASEAPSNRAPVISGAPTLKVVKGEAYSFTPTASDADGDTLTFSLSGRPGWMSFDAMTGALSGTASAADVGIYNDLLLTVSDGEDEATLGPFAIQVLPIGPRSAELTWTPPTENSDGSTLTDLSGYVVYWGTITGNYSNSVILENAGLTSYVIENLAPGQTYYFAMTAYNEGGVESGYSNEASKTVADD